MKLQSILEKLSNIPPKKRLVILFVIIFIVAVILSLPKKQPPLSSQQNIPTKPIPSPTPLPTDTPAPKEKDTSKQAINKFKYKLPIYIENFPTSAGISTTINIYSSDYDPYYTVRLEIYNINYHNSSASPNNPDFVAFKESFIKAKLELTKFDINPGDLIFIFGSRTYIQQTATQWAKELNLPQ